MLKKYLSEGVQGGDSRHILPSNFSTLILWGRGTGVATEDYLLLVGGGGGEALSHPPLTIDNHPWLRPWVGVASASMTDPCDDK